MTIEPYTPSYSRHRKLPVRGDSTFQERRSAFPLMMLREFVKNGDVPDTYHGNYTATAFRDEKSGRRHFQIMFHGNPIFELTDATITLSVGERLDGYGRPSKTVMHVLNELLKSAAYFKLIPEGVRIFHGRREFHAMANVGTLQPVEKFAHFWRDEPRVAILRDPEKLIFPLNETHFPDLT